MYEDLVPISYMCEVLIAILLICKELWQFFSCVRNWYQVFICKMNWFPFFTCKRNWYPFFTHVRGIGTSSSTPPPPPPPPSPPTKKKQKKTLQVWRIFTNSLHVGNHQRILHTCEELVSILHMCEESVPILRTQVAPVLHRCDEYLPILHTSEIINMGNLSTNFRPQNLSKLTIRKFHIWQMWRFDTNPSYGCEIYEWEFYGSTKLLMVIKIFL